MCHCVNRLYHIMSFNVHHLYYTYTIYYAYQCINVVIYRMYVYCTFTDVSDEEQVLEQVRLKWPPVAREPAANRSPLTAHGSRTTALPTGKINTVCQRVNSACHKGNQMSRPIGGGPGGLAIEDLLIETGWRARACRGETREFRSTE